MFLPCGLSWEVGEARDSSPKSRHARKVATGIFVHRELNWEVGEASEARDSSTLLPSDPNKRDFCEPLLLRPWLQSAAALRLRQGEPMGSAPIHANFPILVISRMALILVDSKVMVYLSCRAFFLTIFHNSFTKFS
jgi:hypothetical protein